MGVFLLHNPKAVLIHIPKTGGTSIRNGAWEGNYEGPAFGEIPDDWQSYFKFAFVRHPYDRLISAWKMFTKGTMTRPGLSAEIETRPLSLSEFIDIVTDDNIIYDERRSTYEERVRHHTIPQTHLFNCLRLADYVGRYENIDEDFLQISKTIGQTTELPHIHYTERKHWSEYMSDTDKDRCLDFYKEDFKQLEYR